MIELMRAADLIAGLPIGASETDFEITGVQHDSRRVHPGDLFVALVGERFDGRAFVDDALARGASGVLTSGARPSGVRAPWLVTEDPRSVLGPLAARLAGHPDRELTLVGITGTNGKSTVTALVAAVLEAGGRATGSLGTLGFRFGTETSATSERTTPEATELVPWLREVRDRGADAVVMEVSSHALAFDRVAGLEFDLAVFTNLSRDHFDFHAGFEDYFAAKRQLFERLKSSGSAVVNVADAYGRRLAAELTAEWTGEVVSELVAAPTDLGTPTASESGRPETLVTYGSGGDVSVVEATLDLDGIRARLETPAGVLEISSTLRGRYNLENLLASAACGVALGIEVDAVRAGLEVVGPLPGRLEPVEHGQEFPVFVDYAHTDAALAATLRSLRELAPDRRILCVFGCGGDRDPGKRPLMGRAVGELADLPIVTTDNPRSEDPLAIIAAVETGLKQSGSREYRVVPDRREAIRRALAVADGASLVLVAGKGHEQGQDVGGEVLPFSDLEEIRLALEESARERADG